MASWVLICGHRHWKLLPFVTKTTDWQRVFSFTHRHRKVFPFDTVSQPTGTMRSLYRYRGFIMLALCVHYTGIVRSLYRHCAFIMLASGVLYTGIVRTLYWHRAYIMLASCVHYTCIVRTLCWHRVFFILASCVHGHRAFITLAQRVFIRGHRHRKVISTRPHN